MLAKCVLFIGFLSFTFMPDAHAYIDPGTGSLILQVLAACGIAILAFGRSIIGWVRGLFAKHNQTDDSSHDE